MLASWKEAQNTVKRGEVISTSLLRRNTTTLSAEEDNTPKHLGWPMLTALGIGATIGAGIFAMPGMIALRAGPAGILSFVLAGAVILLVGICYERFSRVMPHGVSAYSYAYYSIGEVVAWVVAFGLFLDYSFGASAVAIAWSEYLKKAFNYQLPAFWSGSLRIDGHFHFGINIIAMAVIMIVTTILIAGGTSKSAKLNFFLVCLKMFLLVLFLILGLKHIQPHNWFPFMPKGLAGVLQGAALAVFPYVGFDALYTFARESKRTKDIGLATYWCVGVVAFLYITVMTVATGLAPCFLGGDPTKPNGLFVGTEAAAPLAMLLSASGETWAARLVAIGAVLGIFNVLLVLCMASPRIFRSMAEDGLLPRIFMQTKQGNPVFGILVNGLVVAAMAGFLPFGDIAELMVLGTLVAFASVTFGAGRLKLISPFWSFIGTASCILLICFLSSLILHVYAISLPCVLLVYFLYGHKHSKLANL